MSTMKLSVIALDRMLYEGEVQRVTAETTAGQITILPNHSPIASILVDAPLIVVNESGEREFIAVHKGYISIMRKEVLVVADDALFAHEIDEARIREDIRRNEEILKNKSGDALDLDRAQVRMQRDLTNLKVYDLFNK